MSSTKRAVRPQSLRGMSPMVGAAKLTKCSVVVGLSTGLLSMPSIVAANQSEAVLAEQVSTVTTTVVDGQVVSTTTQSTESTNIESIDVVAGTKRSPYTNSDSPYKAEISGDIRRTESLLNTPQTIDVLTEEAIKDSGKTDLKEILRAQPGITLGTGENGNAFGDRYIIRGHEARSDIFVDGIRDPGMTTRESFATEQIEITKGPSATFAGRGSTGGAVNSVTKQATTQNSFNEIEVGGGTNQYVRATVDSNVVFSDDTALRINLLHAYEEVPERDPADRSRQGIAASAKHEFTDALSLTGDFYYLNDEDKPDLGTYIEADGNPVDDLPVYVQDEDFLDSEVGVGTLRLDYLLTDNLVLSNSLRYGETTNAYVVTGARASDAIFTADDGSTSTVTVPSLSTHQG